ncbi:hypothetical protein EGW08_014991 [Elysia chlorotica]|uniref:Uncharacterized protein n=1 Tax=Elysia chlorotica TaxID=188477 RepID=A0A433T6T5_ELYCH|nr:hypothetical protein EGW08_014991 [Elysia chlorotica]
MSTSVLSMPYTDRSGGLASGGSSPPSPVNHVTEGPLVLPPSSLRHAPGDNRPRLLGLPGSGLRISFASDTSFAERKLKTRGTSRGNAASLNLRPLEGGEKPQSVRIKLPKATNALHPKQVPLLSTPLREDLMHPRRALDIARSYGVPKYFLRGNSQILTDGRMRLFADNVWKKERMSSPQDGSNGDRKSTENSDVICRLMDSVDKAIATSEKPQPDFSVVVGLGEADGTVGGLRLGQDSPRDGAGAGAGAERERSVLRERFVSFPDVLAKVSAKDAVDDQHGVLVPVTVGSAKLKWDDRKQTTSALRKQEYEESSVRERDSSEDRPGGDGLGVESNVTTDNTIRPHTVDTVTTGYLPRVPHFREPVAAFSNSYRSQGIPEDQIYGNSPRREDGGTRREVKSLSSQAAGIRLRQYKGVLDHLGNGGNPVTPTNNINNRVGVLFGGKYRNVLPRFYPAVSAHHVRQREAAMRLVGGVRLSTTAATGQKRAVPQEASASPQHPPRRLVRFADTPHLIRFSKETSLTPRTSATFKVSASSRVRARERDSMADSGVLVASRAPVQSVQRSLDSHSGLARPEWARLGRVPKCLSTAQRTPATATAVGNVSATAASTKTGDLKHGRDAQNVAAVASPVPATRD